MYEENWSLLRSAGVKNCRHAAYDVPDIDCNRFVPACQLDINQRRLMRQICDWLAECVVGTCHSVFQGERSTDSDDDCLLLMVQGNEVGQAVRAALALEPDEHDVVVLQASDLQSN